ncbi:hypothetical protein D3C81_1800340 [compost metagenome]
MRGAIFIELDFTRQDQRGLDVCGIGHLQAHTGRLDLRIGQYDFVFCLFMAAIGFFSFFSMVLAFGMLGRIGMILAAGFLFRVMFAIAMAVGVAMGIAGAAARFSRQQDQAAQQNTNGNDGCDGHALFFVQIDFHDVFLWLVGVVRRTEDAIDLGGGAVGFG